MDTNKLSLNLNKTKAIVFGSFSSELDFKLIIDGVQIETANENAFLGVIIDNKLSWKAHIRHIKTKISKSLSIINKVKFCLDENAFRTLYCTLVLPFFMYCVEVWVNTYQCTIDPLVKLQKRAVRIIHKVGFLEHTHHLLIYKAFSKLLPSNSQQLFTRRENLHNLRGEGNFKLPRTRTKRKHFCVSVCGVTLWNSLDTQHKQCQNVQ